MRHGKKIHKLSRPTEHRRAVLNNLATALITNKQIQTTDAKARALKPYIDRLISTARQDTLSAKKKVAQYLPNKEAFKELYNNVIPKLEGRTSGFSRIVKYKSRRGDGAPLSIVQLLVEEEVESKGKKKGRKKAALKGAAAARSKKAEEKEPETIAEPEAAAEEAQASAPEESESGEQETGEEKPEAESSEEEKKV